MSQTELSLGLGKPWPPTLSGPEAYTVDFDGPDDPAHPFNWRFSAKLCTSVLVCCGTYVASLDSAIFAPAIPAASRALAIGIEVATLGTALYVLGFAAGPVLWAPASELRGRKWPLALSLLAGAVFTLGSAVAHDVQTLMVCRFFAGVCGAGPLTVVPAVLADLFDNTHRGVAITLYALTVFGGPFTAPFLGGFLVENAALGWRWTLYLPALLAGVVGALAVVCLPETYPPCLLLAKAARLRRRARALGLAHTAWAIHAAHDRVDVDVRHLVHTYFARPLRLLATEPPLLLVSLYMSFVYGLVYGLLTAYPLVFQRVHGLSPGLAGLPFLGLLLGILLAVAFVLAQSRTYARWLAANDNVPVPEWRLVPPLLGGPIFAGGIFWFGWTGWTAHIHWIVPAAAGLFIGFGVLCVFLPCFNYIVDAYLPIAASAVAANIMLRSAVAAGFPLFARQIFENLGIQWGCTLLGCLAALMIPIPYVFRAYGARLRQKSQFAQGGSQASLSDSA